MTTYLLQKLLVTDTGNLPSLVT